MTLLQAFNLINWCVNWYIAATLTDFSLFAKSLSGQHFFNPVKNARSKCIAQDDWGWGHYTICVQICLHMSSIRCLRRTCSSVHIICFMPLGVRRMYRWGESEMKGEWSKYVFIQNDERWIEASVIEKNWNTRLIKHH